ncbi:MAG: heparinase II/III-family protein [Butyrivibrio sp.]|nr:heparinase II/III-family protein [Butyrivibrio sp.]
MFNEFNYSNRDFWNNIYKKELIINKGNEIVSQLSSEGIPELPLQLWCEFIQNGNRVNFEHNFFTRRKFLVTLVMYEGIVNNGSVLPHIAELIWAICEESSWCLPAHNSYYRDKPQLPLPDVSRPVIDLFAAETGALLSMVYRVAGDNLEATYPGIQSRIEYELERRIFIPYKTTHFWWMGHDDEPMCNWTVWCTQNILLSTSILKNDDSEYTNFAIDKADKSIGFFLKDYGEDGCCSEGAQYYRHAGLCLFGALYILDKMAPGKFDHYKKETKIRNIAEYIAHMHVSGKYYLNFADCSPIAGRRSVREHLFGKYVGSDFLAAFAASDFSFDPDPYKFNVQDDSEGINLFYQLLTAYYGNQVCNAAISYSNINQYHFYPSVGLMKVCSDNGMYVAGIKAGNNDDSHNHNDVGSITLYKNGEPSLIDIGVESYTRKTFSNQRYEIWTMQSSWHNLPEFDPEGEKYMQLPGKEFAANIMETYPDKSGLLMDIAGAYNGLNNSRPVKSLGKYLRSVSLSNDGLIIEDSTDYSGLIALTLMTRESVIISENDNSRLICGDSVIELNNIQKVNCEKVSITDPRLLSAWPDTLYRTRIYFTEKVKLIIK